MLVRIRYDFIWNDVLPDPYAGVRKPGNHPRRVDYLDHIVESCCPSPGMYRFWNCMCSCNSRVRWLSSASRIRSWGIQGHFKCYVGGGTSCKLFGVGGRRRVSRACKVLWCPLATGLRDGWLEVWPALNTHYYTSSSGASPSPRLCLITATWKVIDQR